MNDLNSLIKSIFKSRYDLSFRIGVFKENGFNSWIDSISFNSITHDQEDISASLNISDNEYLKTDSTRKLFKLLEDYYGDTQLGFLVSKIDNEGTEEESPIRALEIVEEEVSERDNMYVDVYKFFKTPDAAKKACIKILTEYKKMIKDPAQKGPNNSKEFFEGLKTFEDFSADFFDRAHKSNDYAADTLSVQTEDGKVYNGKVNTSMDNKDEINLYTRDISGNIKDSIHFTKEDFNSLMDGFIASGYLIGTGRIQFKKCEPTYGSNDLPLDSNRADDFFETT